MKLVQKILSILTNLEWIVEINTIMAGMQEGKDSMLLNQVLEKEGSISLFCHFPSIINKGIKIENATW